MKCKALRRESPVEPTGALPNNVHLLLLDDEVAAGSCKCLTDLSAAPFDTEHLAR